MFHTLLPSVDPDDFLHRCYGKSALLFRTDPDLWPATDWRGDHWMDLESLGHVDAAHQGDGVHRLTPIAHSEMAQALGRGRTLCADITQHPPVARCLHSLARGLGVGSGGFAKLYVSPPGHGFPLHLDPHHVFVVQCRGAKRWRYGRTPVLPDATESGKVDDHGRAVFSGRYRGHALTGDGTAIAAPSDSELEEVTLHPGQGLYLPPGTWHSTEADTESVAVSLSPPRRTLFQLLQSFLESRLLVHPAWRSDLSATRSQIRGKASERFVSNMRAAADEMAMALKELDINTLTLQWLADISGDGREPDPVPAPIPQTQYRRIQPLSYLIRGTGKGQECVFYLNGAEYTLQLLAQVFLDNLAEATVFVAKDVLRWDPDLKWEEGRELLAVLEHGGLIHRVSGAVSFWRPGGRSG